MPNKNGTGPEGKGSKTGRGLGRCGNNNGPQNNFGPCGGRGARGFGAGKRVDQRKNGNR